MRLIAPAVLMTLIAAPASAADCSADVMAAFEKQRAGKTYRVAMTQPTAEGPVQMTVDYILPDRMLQTVVAPHMPGEQQTMLIGSRAFAGSGGAFEELLPQFTQSVISEFQAATGSGRNPGKFDCIGKQTLDGKEYVGYRTSGGGADGVALARTVYVEEASGLPAFNIVGTASGAGEPVMKAAYSYPKDVVIEAPASAPVQKLP